MIMDTRWEYLYNFQRFSCQFAFSVLVSFNVAVKFPMLHAPVHLLEALALDTKTTKRLNQEQISILHPIFRRLNAV